MSFVAQFVLYGGAQWVPGHIVATFLMHATRSTSSRRTFLARASLVLRERGTGADDIQFRHYSSEVEDAEFLRVRDLARQLCALGQPEIEFALDTSEGWVHLSLAVLDDSEPWRLELPLYLSGFTGRDAPLLDSALRGLIASSGVGSAWILERLQGV